MRPSLDYLLAQTRRPRHLVYYQDAHHPSMARCLPIRMDPPAKSRRSRRSTPVKAKTPARVRAVASPATTAAKARTLARARAAARLMVPSCLMNQRSHPDRRESARQFFRTSDNSESGRRFRRALFEWSFIGQIERSCEVLRKMKRHRNQ